MFIAVCGMNCVELEVAAQDEDIMYMSDGERYYIEDEGNNIVIISDVM